MNAHSILFVPGDRPERFAKALASAAHLVCIDLEDAVAPQNRSVAREAVLDFLPHAPTGRLAVRINCLRARDGLADLLALSEATALPALVLIPKVEAAAELLIAAGTLRDERVGLLALIESQEGLVHVVDVARTRRCAGVAFGGVDFAAELGVAGSWETLLAARTAIVYACARAGVPAFDAPYIYMSDEAGLAAEVLRAKALGFAGKVVIHPGHVDAVNAAFRPSAAEIAEARAALAAYGAAQGGASRLNGTLLEAPVMQRYRRIVAAADEIQ